MLGYKIWHKDLITKLPDNMLLILYQNLADYALNPVVPKKVNPYKDKLSEFNKSHFYNYCCEVYNEITKRKYDDETMKCINEYSDCIKEFVSDMEKQIGASITHEQLFNSWHNARYLNQCLYALEEMYDYGLISESEWGNINGTN